MITRPIPPERYRNIGILASLDAGRTTTTERILALAGRAARESVPGPRDGRPVWVEQDNERDITLTSAATSCVWRDCRITLVDLPDAARAAADGTLTVLDAVVVVIDATTGVTPELASALAQVEAQGLARLVFVNKLDRAGADLPAVLAELAALCRPVLLQMPIGTGTSLRGLIDVVEETALLWPEAPYDAPGTEGAVPEALLFETRRARAAIRAAVAGPLDPAGLARSLRAAAGAGAVVPVLGGSAFRNRGIGELLDAIVDYLPAPSELPLRAVAADGSAVERRPSDEEPFTGLAFQTVDDPASGKLTFVRIYSGVVARGSVLLNTARTSPERIGPMVRMHANHAEAIEEAGAGDIVALAGLEHTTTGDTLCDPDAPVILERVPARAGRAKH